jgi:hypothetical protein
MVLYPKSNILPTAALSYLGWQRYKAEGVKIIMFDQMHARHAFHDTTIICIAAQLTSHCKRLRPGWLTLFVQGHPFACLIEYTEWPTLVCFGLVDDALDHCSLRGKFGTVGVHAVLEFRAHINRKHVNIDDAKSALMTARRDAKHHWKFSGLTFGGGRLGRLFRSRRRLLALQLVGPGGLGSGNIASDPLLRRHGSKALPALCGGPCPWGDDYLVYDFHGGYFVSASTTFRSVLGLAVSIRAICFVFRCFTVNLASRFWGLASMPISKEC